MWHNFPGFGPRVCARACVRARARVRGTPLKFCHMRHLLTRDQHHVELIGVAQRSYDPVQVLPPFCHPRHLDRGGMEGGGCAWWLEVG